MKKIHDYELELNFKFSIDCNSNEEPDEYLIRHYGDITFHPEDEEVRTIGRISFYLAQVDRAFNDGMSLSHVFDCAGSEELGLYEEALDDDSENGFSDAVNKKFSDLLPGNLLVLDRISLDPEYRGQGVGKIVINRILEVFGLNCTLAVLMASPLQFLEPHKESKDFLGSLSNDENAALSKLVRYWAKLGFKKIGSSHQGKYQVMAKLIPQ